MDVPGGLTVGIWSDTWKNLKDKLNEIKSSVSKASNLQVSGQRVGSLWNELRAEHGTTIPYRRAVDFDLYALRFAGSCRILDSPRETGGQDIQTGRVHETFAEGEPCRGCLPLYTLLTMSTSTNSERRYERGGFPA